MPSQISSLVTRPQHEAARVAIKRGLSVARIPAPLDGNEWAINHFWLSGESSAIEGPWRPSPPQVELLRLMTNDDVRILDVLKCARIGYTKMLLAAGGYFIEHKKRSGAIYQPTDSDAKEFSKGEVDPAIRDCRALAAALKGDAEKRGRNNTQELKQFLGAMLYIRGGHSGRSYRRLTIDWVMYDELEAFERDIDDEGDPVSLGDKRISNSANPKSIRGSTPKLKADSLIYHEAESARHLFRYRVHCPECHQPQAMVWGQFRWKEGQPETVRYVCESCEAPWTYKQMGDLLERGFWGTDDGYLIQDGRLHDPDGMVVDWPRHVAVHIWAAYSEWFTWQELVEEWLEATAKNKQGDSRKLKTFTNTRLAEPWEDEGEQVEHSELYQRREQYDRPPADVRLLTATFDVQENRIEGEVVGHRRGDETWGVEYVVIYGDTSQRETWDDLEEFINRTWRTDDGRQLRIAAVGIDTGYLPDMGYGFYKRTRHPRVYCIKGVGGEDKPIVSAPQQRKAGRSKAKAPLFLMGSDVCKQLVYKRLLVEEPGPGYQHFPDTYGEDYFRGLTAEKRVERRRKGFTIHEWIKERARNEQLDVRAMTVCVLAILNPAWDALDPGPEPPPPVEDAPRDEYTPRRHQQRRRRGYGDRWRQ